MPKTLTQFSVNDVGDPEPVIVGSYCNRRVVIEEDPFAAGWPREWTLRAPLQTDPARNKAAGASQVFEVVGRPGEIIGYVETRSGAGATTFNQFEE